jgi:hypothetical protein
MRQNVYTRITYAADQAVENRLKLDIVDEEILC